MLITHKLPVSYIVNKIKYELLLTLLITIFIYHITHAYRDILPTISFTIPAFIGTAISILLSFKLNQSYDRWWEARKIWGSIVNDSRTLVIQLQTLLQKPNRNLVHKIGFRQIAWCYSLGQSLRGLDPTENLETYLDQGEISELKKHNNKPLKLLQMHAQDLQKLKESSSLELFSQIHINNTIVKLTDAMGKAERIKTTVFPITYRILLHLIIYLFVIILSISLTNFSLFFEISLLLSIASVFFLLDKTALHLQDPFSNRSTDVSVTAIARTIEINIKQLLEEHDIPKPAIAEKYFLM